MKNETTEYGILASDNAVKGNFSLLIVLSLLYGKRYAAILIFIAVLSTVAAVSWLMPKAYVAQAKLMMQKGRAEMLVSTGETNTAVKPDVNEQAMNSEIEIIKSTILLREVVKSTGLHTKIMESKGVSDPEDAIEMAIGGLKQGLEAEMIPKSTVIQVRYESSDPKFSAYLVNEVCRLYLDRHLEVRKSRGIYAFYQRQAQMLSDSLDLLTEQLQTHKRQYNIIDPKQQRELVLQQLAGYEKDLAANRADVMEAGRKAEYLRERLDIEPGRIQKRIRSVHNSAVESMYRELDSLKAEHAQIKKSFSGENGQSARPNAYLEQPLKARIAQLEETVMRIELSPALETTSDIAGSIKSLSQGLTEANTQLVGLKARENILLKTVKNLQQRADTLELGSLTYETLQRKWEITHNNYLHYLKKQEEARIAEGLDREKVANVSILDAATAPLLPIRPNLKLNLAIGFVLAAIMGLGGALFLGYFNNDIHTRFDIERMEGVSLLASVGQNQWAAGILNLEDFERWQLKTAFRAQRKELNTSSNNDH